MNLPNINDNVMIIDGDLKGKIGVVLDEYQGWNFIQYTIKLIENNKEYTFYHDEIKLMS